jgi:hypothetical protein
VRIQVTLLVVSLAAAGWACGARTGLPGLPIEPPEAGTGGAPADAGRDAGPDVVDAPADAPPDVVATSCEDAGITYIYLIGNDNQLLRFYPPTLTAEPIGVIDCPVTVNPQATPYSMAVDRQGIAYVVFTDGELFRVSTLTASCEATPFQIGQGGFSQQFGMGYSADTNDPGEELFVAGNLSEQLAMLDTTTFTIHPVGTFSSMIGEAELTGTGGGDLYAFGIVLDPDGGATDALHLSQIDKTTAAVLSDTFVTVATQSAPIFDWAFAYWGGDFYFFTSTDQMTTNVSRYIPGGSLALPTVTTLDTAVVGAGVSTCAPQQ